MQSTPKDVFKTHYRKYLKTSIFKSKRKMQEKNALVFFN